MNKPHDKQMILDMTREVYDAVLTACHNAETIPDSGALERLLAEHFAGASGYDASLAIDAGRRRAHMQMMKDAAQTQAFLDSEVGQTMRSIPEMTMGEAMRLHGYWKERP